MRKFDFRHNHLSMHIRKPAELHIENRGSVRRRRQESSQRRMRVIRPMASASSLGLVGGFALSERTTALVSFVSMDDSEPLAVSIRLTSGVVPRSPKGSCANASVAQHAPRTAKAVREIASMRGLDVRAVAKVIGFTRLVSCVMMRIRPDGPPKSLPWCGQLPQLSKSVYPGKFI